MVSRVVGSATALAPTIAPAWSASAFWPRACGLAQVMTTVFGSGAATSVISCEPPLPKLPLTSSCRCPARRSRLPLTSVESSFEPSVKVTPSLSVSVSWVLSALFWNFVDQAGNDLALRVGHEQRVVHAS